jgi:hypothetical protein
MWSPAWAWGILAAAVTVYVAIFDVHAAIAHTETMTGRMRDWLADPVIGPFAFAFWLALFGGWMYHLFLRARGR